MAHHTRQATQNQSDADSGNGSAPIALNPVAECPNPGDREESSQERPTGWEPGLQHPADGRAHNRNTDPDSEPGAPKERFPGGERQPLRWWITRHVSRLLDNVETLEMLPLAACGVREAALGEGIRGQQVTGFVLYLRSRNRFV